MANNYLQFSVLIPCPTEATKQALVTAFEQEAKSDDGAPCQYEIESDGLWLYAEEYGDVERVADIVAAWQQAQAIEAPWVLTWATTCSKMRLDEFSGGAVAVYKGRAEYFVPEQLAAAWITQQA